MAVNRPGMAPKALPVALLLLAAALAGCSSSTDDGGSGGSGSASAYVKDKPSDDFREVHLVFTEVAVHRSGGSGNGTSSTGSTNSTGTATGVSTGVGNTTLSASVTASATETPTPEAGWIVLFSDAAGVDVDLLNTTGAKAAFLGETDLAAGHYQQVRATVKEAYGVTQNGSREDITVSSGTVKVVRGFDVESGKETRITLDLDLSRSLHQQGNGEWRLTPVVGKTTAAVVDDEDSGSDQAQPGDVEDVPESG
jgi:hypothetical protein